MLSIGIHIVVDTNYLSLLVDATRRVVRLNLITLSINWICDPTNKKRGLYNQIYFCFFAIRIHVFFITESRNKLAKNWIFTNYCCMRKQINNFQLKRCTVNMSHVNNKWPPTTVILLASKSFFAALFSIN